MSQSFFFVRYGRAYLLALSLLYGPPALAQMPCPAPESGIASLRKLNEDFTNHVTLPLLKHDAGGLGPRLWAFIAGQARAESLLNMKDKKNRFHSKASNNLWNVQLEGCSNRKPVEDECLLHNRGKPLAKSRAEAAKNPSLTPCWMEGERRMQVVWVCFASYSTIEQAANHYLEFKPPYTEQLEALSKQDAVSAEQFVETLIGSAWSTRAKNDKEKYRKETLANIDETLRGIAQSRQSAEKQLDRVNERIAGWCAQEGPGSDTEREALQREQDTLLEEIGFFDKVCERGQTPSPTRNRAIDDCRTASSPADTPTSASTPGSAQTSGPTPTGNPIEDKQIKSASGGVGEPHYVTPGGTLFSTQRAGEFWLLESRRAAEIQVRQEPWQSSESVAVISAVAVRAGQRRVGVYAADDSVRVDGRPLRWPGGFLQFDLGGGHVLGVWGTSARPEVVAVMWADGSTLRMARHGSWIDVDYRIMRRVDTSGDAGLIGRPDADPANDFVLRSGERLNAPDAARIDAEQIDRFVESWRIAAEESLFDYAPGTSAADFDRRDFPRKAAAPSPQALDQAREACAELKLSGAMLDACAFDLAVTGDRTFLESHRAAAQMVGAGTSAARTGKAPLAAKPRAFFAAKFRPEMDGAVPLPNGHVHEMLVGPGEEKTFLVEITKPDVSDLFVHSRQFTCIGGRYDGKTPGYQLFDQQGRAISDAMATCGDLYSGAITPGRYYVVVVGARSGAAVRVKFEPFHY